MAPVTEPRERDPWTERLSEYLDGELPRPERDALERHVADCAVCTVTLADLRAVVGQARTLDDLPPAQDLWPAIEARIAPAARRAPSLAPAFAWWQRRLDFSLPQLAAAALVLAALSAGAMWLALRQSPVSEPIGGAPAPLAAREPAAPDRSDDATPDQAPTPGPASNGTASPRPDPLAAGDDPDATTAAVVSASPAAYDSPRYDQAVAELEQVLAAGRGRLEPRTLKVLEDNLRTIDRAIEEARRAVAADPANAWLRSHLAQTMKRKVDLLRTATMLTAAG